MANLFCQINNELLSLISFLRKFLIYAARVYIRRNRSILVPSNIVETRNRRFEMEQEATINHFVEFRLNIYASGIFWLILQIELEMSKVSSSARLNDF